MLCGPCSSTLSPSAVSLATFSQVDSFTPDTKLCPGNELKEKGPSRSARPSPHTSTGSCDQRDPEPTLPSTPPDHLSLSWPEGHREGIWAGEVRASGAGVSPRQGSMLCEPSGSTSLYR